MSKAQRIITDGRKAAEKYLDDVSEHGSCSCEHGHFDCALHDDGPCANEVAGLIEVLDEEDIAAREEAARED